MMMGETESVEELDVKKPKLLESEDWISALPDSIIQHILSFLPSTREAVQTCILSKRWKNQWTGVPVLIFDFDECSSTFVDNTLIRYDCSKIRKFRILKEGNHGEEYSNFIEFISFAIRKHVKELILDFFFCDLMLPEIIFDCSSLVRLKACSCAFKPNGKVSWERLKELDLAYCTLNDDVVDKILCGSPVLESLVLDGCYRLDRLVIVSEHLKKLKLGVDISVLEISCPNLEELYLVENFVAHTIKLVNVSSLNHATLDFDKYNGSCPQMILKQVKHVKDLKLGIELIEFLSSLEVRACISLPLLSSKCLTLRHPDFNKHSSAIVRALLMSHLLEELVIIKYCNQTAEIFGSTDNYWYSNGAVYNSLVSHLKFVDIINLSRKDVDYEQVLNFIEFILKNAKVLEKLTVCIENDERDFMLEVSLELLSFSRCSQDATIEFRYFRE